MKEQPNYYAILPANVRYDNELTPLQKLLFAEITALSNKEGYCWASNSYFAELYGVSETHISLCIKKLRQKNYINSDIDKKKGNIRYLTPIKIELNTYLTKVKDPYLTKVKDNIINTNIKNNIERELSYLEELPQEDIQYFTREFDLTERQLKNKAEELADYCRAKGRKYSNYKAFLRNAIRKDFKKRVINPYIQRKELPPEVRGSNLDKMAEIKAKIGVI